MNFDRIIFVIKKELRVIKVEYDPEAVSNGAKPNTSLVKTFDTQVKVGDSVVVPTNSRAMMTVAQVVEVDVNIEVKSGGPIPWLISKVHELDISNHERLKEMEAEAIKELMKVEMENEREQLRDNLQAYQKNAIEKLAIAQIGSEQPAPETPPSSPIQENF